MVRRFTSQAQPGARDSHSNITITQYRTSRGPRRTADAVTHQHTIPFVNPHAICGCPEWGLVERCK
eukprot:4196588-Prymnesium_polylepis.1